MGTVISHSDAIELLMDDLFGYEMYWTRCVGCGWASGRYGHVPEAVVIGALHECEAL